MIYRVVKNIMFYLMLMMIWEVSYRICVEYLHLWEAYSFSSPSSVLMSFIQMIKDNNTLGIAVLISFRRVLIGYFISVIIGIILSLALVSFKYLGDNFSSLFLGLQALPNVCWIPFALLWYGLNEKAIIFVVVVGSTFSIANTVESGIKNINPIYIKVAKTMGAKGFAIYKDVILPAAFPNIISGMKQGWSFSWRALMTGEVLSSSIGLGQLLMMGRDIFDMSQVIAVILIIMVSGMIVDRLIFGKIEARVRCRWGLQ